MCPVGGSDVAGVVQGWVLSRLTLVLMVSETPLKEGVRAAII